MYCRHPEIVVKLVGMDGNAFAIIGRVQQALKDAGIPREQIAEFRQQATSGDYDHPLTTVMK